MLEHLALGGCIGTAERLECSLSYSRLTMQLISLLVLAQVAVLQSGCPQPLAPAVQASTATQAAVVEAPWRETLLDFAFESADRMQSAAHARDRARLQEAVGLALLDADLPSRAAERARSIEGWRRGALLAAVALEEAKAGRVDDARVLAKQALALAQTQLDWQRERIQVMVARAYAWIGDESEAARLEQGVGEPEMGKVAAARAARAPEVGFDAQMTALDDWLKTKNFDLVRNAVEICLEFYPATFKEPARRARVEAAVALANAQLPLEVRIDILLRMADIARRQSDLDAARAFISQAESQLAAGTWMADDQVVQVALIATTQARLASTADLDAATKSLLHGEEIFAAARDRIVDIARARPLRALAEGYAAVGDKTSARRVYAQALREGIVNPNARPRTDDLVQTAISISRSGVEPDAATRDALAAIREGLVAPW